MKERKVAINRDLINASIVALEKGETLSDESRNYAIKILSIVNSLAFDNYDLERIYEQRQLEQGKKISATMNDMRLLKIAYEAGRGLKEAEAVIQARREAKFRIPAGVAFIQIIEGITQTKAQRRYAELFGLEHDNVKSICARHKRKIARR